jgi:hypothetical protein
MLQYDVVVSTDQQKTQLLGLASLFRDITADAQTRLLRNCLATCHGFQQNFHNFMILL